MEKYLYDTFIDSYWVQQYHAKTKKYKPNIYYHVHTGGSNAGVGKGLYLGRDKDALISFYDNGGEGRKVDTYIGNPKWADLLDYNEYKKFEKEAIKKYGGKYKPTNSISDLEERGEFVQKLAIEKGFDGIRYYDPSATGEEYVLFNTKTVKEIKTEKMFKGGLIKNKHSSLGSSKELSISPIIREHDMIAECGDCGDKFSYQNSKNHILWECPECKSIKRIS